MGEFQCPNCGGEMFEQEEPKNNFYPTLRVVNGQCKKKCGVQSVRIVITEEEKNAP